MSLNPFLQGMLAALSVSLLVVLVAFQWRVKRLMKQLHSEKWTNRKSQAYGQIVGHLFFLRTYYQEQFDDSCQRLSSDDTQVEKHYEQAKTILTHAASVGGHLISEQASESLINLLRTLRQVSLGSDAMSYFATCFDLVHDCSRRVRIYVEADLKGTGEQPGRPFDLVDGARQQISGRRVQVN